jgi:hypothetical protein
MKVKKNLGLASIKPNHDNNNMCENWILDSGATDHMTENVNLIKKIQQDR